MPNQKFYVVWKGRKTGIFTSWADCEKQVKGYKDAEFKAFDSKPEAERAFAKGFQDVKGKPSSLGRWKEADIQPYLPCICVDAACSGSPRPVSSTSIGL